MTRVSEMPNSNSNGSIFAPPSRPAAFPEKACKTRNSNPSINQNSQKCLNTAVAMPLSVQVGLMYLASNQPDKLTKQFKARAREMLTELDINQLEICEDID